MTSHGDRYLNIAVPSPLRRLFDYLPPRDMAIEDCRPGMRVRVPFGRRQLVGVIISRAVTTDIETKKLKRVSAMIDSEPVLEQQLLDLMLWSANYYQHPPGDVIHSVIPGLLRQGRKAAFSADSRWQCTAPACTYDVNHLARAPRQAALLQLLQQHPAGLDSAGLKNHGVYSRPALRALLEKDLITEIKNTRPVAKQRAPSENITHTAEQKNAIRAVTSKLGQYHCFLLNGVTGSGKTEVYIQLIHAVLEKQQQALILLPEINLTPQFIQRLEQGIQSPVAVYHSGLSDRERLNTWIMARDQSAQVFLGTRSAIWLPLRSPGLYIVDEEHELSYKQQEGFRYSARDLAIVRAKNDRCPVLLGTATPS
ncbi:MAG: DEAD/DEAH box helicase family protein, partial [Thiotrichales bacterium]|nr:DEAD/DEAH box helicase family protein [Thiotrichales bacterium]